MVHARGQRDALVAMGRNTFCPLVNDDPTEPCRWGGGLLLGTSPRRLTWAAYHVTTMVKPVSVFASTAYYRRMEMLGSAAGFVRSALFGLAVLVLVAVALAANLGIWASRAVLDPAVFVTTADDAIADPGIRADIAGALADRLYTVVAEQSGQVPEDLLTSLGLDPAATRQQVTATLTSLVDTVLTEPDLAPARDAAFRKIHDAILGAGTGSGGISIQGDDLSLDFDVLLQRTLAEVDPTLPTADISTGLGSIVILRSNELGIVGWVLQRLDVAIWVLPLLVVVAALLVMLLARHRLHALSSVGAAVACAGGIGLAIALLGATALTAGSSPGPDRDAASGLWSGLFESLLPQSVLFAVIGLVLAVLGIILGSRVGARRRMRFA